MKSDILTPIIIFIIVIFGGSFIYSTLEGWRYLDSIYFTVVTVATIGYGDFVPQTDAGKIFTLIFSFVGIGMAFYFFSLMGRYVFQKQLKKELSKSEKSRYKKKIKT